MFSKVRDILESIKVHLKILRSFSQCKTYEDLSDQFNCTCLWNKMTQASIDLLKIQSNVPNVMLNMVDALSLLFLFEKNEARKQSFTNFLQKRCS